MFDRTEAPPVVPGRSAVLKNTSLVGGGVLRGGCQPGVAGDPKPVGWVLVFRVGVSLLFWKAGAGFGPPERPRYASLTIKEARQDNEKEA